MWWDLIIRKNASKTLEAYINGVFFLMLITFYESL